MRVRVKVGGSKWGGGTEGKTLFAAAAVEAQGKGIHKWKTSVSERDFCHALHHQPPPCTLQFVWGFFLIERVI